jgi:hypothetical protein
VNEPRTLKAVVPAALAAGTAYRLKIVTQSSARNGAELLKNQWDVWPDFTLTARQA